MLWGENIPIYQSEDGKTKINVIAGQIAQTKAPEPAPDSWAAEADNEVGIWTIEMQAGANWSFPKGKATTNRSLYFYEGDKVTINERNNQHSQVHRTKSGCRSSYH